MKTETITQLMVDKINYYWYLPDEGIRLYTTTEPTYFRRFVMWLMHNAEFVIEYKKVDT
jgi:hypothetical protein